MDDTNDISTEYGWISDKLDNLSWSFHQNKKVLYFRATKDGYNHRFRFGFSLGGATDKDHSVCVEILFDNESYRDEAVISASGTGISIPFYHTEKFSYNIGSTEYYYTKTVSNCN